MIEGQVKQFNELWGPQQKVFRTHTDAQSVLPGPYWCTLGGGGGGGGAKKGQSQRAIGLVHTTTSSLLTVETMIEGQCQRIQ